MDCKAKADCKKQPAFFIVYLFFFSLCFFLDMIANEKRYANITMHKDKMMIQKITPISFFFPQPSVFFVIQKEVRDYFTVEVDRECREGEDKDQIV